MAGWKSQKSIISLFLSESSERASTDSATSPRANSITYPGTSYPALVTTEESSLVNSCNDGSTSSSNAFFHSKKTIPIDQEERGSITENSSQSLIHLHKRRKKVGANSSLPEKENKRTDPRSSSSDTSEKDDSSSSSLQNEDDSSESYSHKHQFKRKVEMVSNLPKMKKQSTESSSASSDTSGRDGSSSSSSSRLLYKDGKTNSNIETYLFLRVHQKGKVTSSSDTIEQNGQVPQIEFSKKRGKELIAREQNTSATSESTHDGTVSKLSSSTYAQSLDSRSIYTSSDTRDTKMKDNARKTKNNVNNALEIHSVSFSSASLHSHSKERPKNKKHAICSLVKAHSHQGSTSSPDTSDPDSASTSSSSSSVKRAKKIVGKALHDYLSSFSSTTAGVGEGGTLKNAKVDEGDAGEKNAGSFLRSDSSASSSTSESSDACAEKKVSNDTANAQVDTDTNDEKKIDNGNIADYHEGGKSINITTGYESVNTRVAVTDAPSVPRFYSSAPYEEFSPESLASKIDNCIYHDQSHITPEAALSEMQNRSTPKRMFTKEPSFPQKVHQILSDPESKKWITWLPHGRAWKIINQKRFEEDVLPCYFRHGKLASFMRQVRNWGFKRIPDGPDQNAYYNEYFLRGLPHISVKMRRQPTGRREERLNSVFPLIHLTPDLYQISREYPLPDENGVFHPQENHHI